MDNATTHRRVSDHEVKFALLNMKSVDDEGVFSGYASLFDKEDLEKDVVAPGAFARSLRKRGIFGVKMLYQHNPNDVIGVWNNIYEDHRGLFVSGQLLLETAQARDIFYLMQAGALDGLSIGFRTLKSVRNRQAGSRRLTEIDLWEISVVTFPMQPDARVSQLNRSDRAYENSDIPLENIIGQATQKMRLAAQMTVQKTV